MEALTVVASTSGPCGAYIKDFLGQLPALLGRGDQQENEEKKVAPESPKAPKLYQIREGLRRADPISH